MSTGRARQGGGVGTLDDSESEANRDHDLLMAEHDMGLAWVSIGCVRTVFRINSGVGASCTDSGSAVRCWIRWERRCVYAVIRNCMPNARAFRITVTKVGLPFSDNSL